MWRANAPPCARLAGRLAALPGCDGPRALRRGSRLRPAARRPPVSPGTEGRDMPAAAAPPAPAPPAPAAAATAPSPEALGDKAGKDEENWLCSPGTPSSSCASGSYLWSREELSCPEHCSHSGKDQGYHGERYQISLDQGDVSRPDR